jgi:putative peptidoglycan lipid II flippase
MDDAPGSGSRRNSALVSAGILLSRLAGFIRLRALSHFLGAGIAVDAFNAAFRIPNLLQNLLGEGVLSASFIPVYSRLLAEGREEEAGRVAGAVAGLLAMVSAFLVVIGLVFAAPLTRLIAPGLTQETFELTVTLMRIIFPGIGALVLSAWCLGVLNSHRRFFLSYVAPVIWNVAQIAALVGFGIAGLRGGDLAVALAWGTVAGGVLQFAVQVPPVVRLIGAELRPSLDTSLPGVRDVLRSFGPIVAGRGVVQLMTFVELALASLLAVGAYSVLGYAQPLYILPISLFGMAVAAAELPELSSMGAEDRDRLQGRLDAGLARISFYVAFCAAAFIAIGESIVGALYQSGAFTALDRRLVWLVLVGFSVGLLSNTSSRLLQSALYGTGDAKGPAWIAAIRVLIAACVGGLLMLQLDRVGLTPDGGFELLGSLPAFTPLPEALRSTEGLYRLGAMGLSLAAGASSWLEFALLRRRVRERLGPSVRVGGGVLGRQLLALVPAVAAGLLIDAALGGLPLLLTGPLALGGMGLTYVGTAHALRIDEARELTGAVLRRLPGGR